MINPNISPVCRARSARRDLAGLTLIELVVVIAILAILAGFIIPLVANYREQARDTSAKASLVAIRDAIVGTPSQPGYYSDTGQYPNTLRDLFIQPTGMALFDRDTTRGWHGPYLSNAIGALYKNNNSADGSFLSGTYPVPYGYPGDPIILDPWGNAIVIQWPTSGTAIQNPQFIRLISAGPNGIIDTPIVDSSSAETFYPQPGDRGDDIVLFLNHADSYP